MLRIEGSESHKSLARPEEDEDVFEAESVVEAIGKLSLLVNLKGLLLLLFGLNLLH